MVENTIMSESSQPTIQVVISVAQPPITIINPRACSSEAGEAHVPKLL
jgi:hypothetical protein